MFVSNSICSQGPYILIGMCQRKRICVSAATLAMASNYTDAIDIILIVEFVEYDAVDEGELYYDS